MIRLEMYVMSWIFLKYKLKFFQKNLKKLLVILEVSLVFYERKVYVNESFVG